MSHDLWYTYWGQVNGLAVLHECGNFEIGSHSTGDYFLAGRPTAEMANSGVSWLPEVITFTHPVTELSLYACGCRTSLGYSLSLTGYAGPQATGAELANHSQLTTREWQLWTVEAPENAPLQKRGTPRGQQHGDPGCGQPGVEMGRVAGFSGRRDV